MFNFAESGHPLFFSCQLVLWKEESWKAKEKERNLFTSTVSDETIELILRTVISVNQLSIYGEVAEVV